MDKFLGHDSSWWIAVHAVLRKERLEDPDVLAARLGTTAPPFWTKERSEERRRELEMEST